MEFKTLPFTDRSGNVISGATVVVYQAGTTTPVTVYDEDGAEISSLTTNGNGVVSFAAPDGVYDVTASFGTASFTIENLQFQAKRYDTFAALDAATNLGPTGTIVEAAGHRYKVVASGEDFTTSGGFKVKVLVGNDGTVSTAAFSDPAVAPSVAGAGGVVAVPSNADAGASAPANPGASFIGEHGLFFEEATGFRQLANRPGRSPECLAWGHENLVRWLEGLRTGESLKVALVGDSNTAGYVGTTLATSLESLANITLTNFGVGGTDIEQWRAGTAPYDMNGLALSDVAAFDPDLIVMCWGTNDPLRSRDAEAFATSLDAALTTIRGTLDINDCSIALLTPNAMARDGRDELWSLQIRPRIRAAAEKFECGYYDKNGFFPNSTVDLATGAMQDKWWDNGRTHTADLATSIIASQIAEWLAPRELWERVWETIPKKDAVDAPDTYPPGMSIARMSDGAFNGFVATFKPAASAGHFPIQFNWKYSGSDARFAHRVGLSGVWSPWKITGPEPNEKVGSLASGYEFSGGSTDLNTLRDNDTVSLSGRLIVNPADQVITATTLANITNTEHRPNLNVQDAVAVCTNAGGDVERLRADVTTAGNIVVRETSTMTDCNKLAINLFYRGA